MSKVTPPGPAGAERLTVKVKVVVPALASFWETSVTVRLGRATRGLWRDDEVVDATYSSLPAPCGPDRDLEADASVRSAAQPVIEKIGVTRLAASCR